MKGCFSSPEHEKVAPSEATPDRHTDADLVPPVASSATGGLASPRVIEHISRRRRKDLYRHLIALASAAALFACCGGATAEEGSAPGVTSTGQGGKETVSREDQPGGFELEEMIEEDGSSNRYSSWGAGPT
jgi:hypothetical protein